MEFITCSKGLEIFHFSCPESFDAALSPGHVVASKRDIITGPSSERLPLPKHCLGAETQIESIKLVSEHVCC